MSFAMRYFPNLNFRLFGLLSFTFFYCFSPLLFSQVVFNPPSGKYQKPLSVTISCEIPGAVIYYTTDGSEPSTASLVYTGQPILVANHSVGDSLTFSADNDPDPEDDYQPQTFKSMIIKAIAVAGSEQSPVAEAIYVLDLVDATFDIAYADPPPAGGSKHQLDVYQPHDEKNNAVLLFIHGGAWKQGDKNIYMELGNTFAGYYHFTTVVANYQLSTDPWHAVHPTHVQDVAMAFGWVYNHIAEYGGDPEKIYVFGQSAGGHLVSLLATDSTYLNTHGLGPRLINSLVTMSGAYDLYDLVQWPINPLGLSTLEVAEYKTLCLLAFGGWDQGVLDSASPEKFIHPDQPPFYIISIIESGEFEDMPGFCKEADNFFDAISKLSGVMVDLKRLTQADIPPEIVAVDFPGNSEGHWEEIYAINSKYWDSVPTKMVIDFIKQLPAIPVLANPLAGANDVPKDVTLGWHSGKNTTYYQLQLATHLSFVDSLVVFNSLIADTIWTISNLLPNTQYFWRVKAISAAGESDWSAAGNFSTETGTMVTENKIMIPHSFSLDLFPNPFNGNLKLRVQTNKLIPGELVQVEIFNILGERVFKQQIHVVSNQHDFNWIAANDLPGGIYLIRLSYGAAQIYKKAVYVK